MPFHRKQSSGSSPSSPKSSPSPSSDSTRSRNHSSLRTYLTTKVRLSISRNHNTPKTKPARQHTHQTEPQSATPKPKSQPLTQWEDINPPRHLSSLNNTQRLLNTSHPDDQETKPPAVSLPEYNDVSGAVVVDADGCPRFLTPREERDRAAALQRAVRERMLGLPVSKQGGFSWEVSARPVLSGYEVSEEK
ncbi:hypothetical protein BJX61DRAFT_502173 [Aspergillus egyptiacus]|nr:hypothetical protein BJX61DRAFT_502173 [Aspergillus egyptiacus]